jgi:hypothetical protein
LYSRSLRRSVRTVGTVLNAIWVFDGSKTDISPNFIAAAMSWLGISCTIKTFDTFTLSFLETCF